MAENGIKAVIPDLIRYPELNEFLQDWTGFRVALRLHGMTEVMIPCSRIEVLDRLSFACTEVYQPKAGLPAYVFGELASLCFWLVYPPGGDEQRVG